MSRRLLASFIVVLLWRLTTLAFAGQGCCSTHGGVAGCASGKAQCQDGTLSPTCGCEGTADSRANDSNGLAFLGTNPPEVKPSPTPIFGLGPDKTIDTIPPNDGRPVGDQIPDKAGSTNTGDSLSPQQPPKPYTTEGTSNTKGSDGFKKPKAGLSGKEAGTDVPSWAQGQRPRNIESGKEFAKRLLDAKYGRGKYPKGPGSEFNKIKKWGDRAFE